MTFEYTKSVTSDFGGNILLEQFHNEIESEAGITTTFTGLTQTADEIVIVFASELSGGELTTLNSLISSHTPDTAPTKIYSYRVYPEERKIKTTDWRLIGSFEYPGTNVKGNIIYIDIVSSIDSASGTFNVEIVGGGNTLLANGTFSNTSLASNELTLINPFMSTKDIIEISIKCSSKQRTANIQEIIFWYEFD
jgi:hypothetical protein